MTVSLKDVFSSNVNQVGYDPDTQEMHIVWNTGKRSVYSGVPQNVATKTANAYSVGKFVSENIKPNYEHRYV
jgi:KTSC domain